MRHLLSESLRAWTAAAASVLVVFGYMFVAGWPEASSYMGEYIALMMVGFLLVYVGVTIAAFSLTPFQQVAEWARRQRATFVGRYLVMNQPGGGLALYFSVLALVLSLLILPRVDSMANVLSPPALTGVVVALVFLAWLAVAVTQSLDYLASHHRLGEDVLVFPGTEKPTYTDYLYLAVGVSASFAPPDVKVQSSTIRRRVTLHTLVAFVFNTVILASVVSALSNALDGA